MAREIKYGMLGGSIYDFIGDVHRKAIAFDARAELVCGCFSTSQSKNEDTANAYGISKERTYPDYKTMAKAESSREDGIDFVSITTPNYLHYEMAKEFLNAGIHVVCEKPLCFTVKEAEELRDLAKAKGLFFGVTYTYTGYTMVKVAKEMIAAGKIGDVISVNAEYAQDWLLNELTAKSGDEKQNNISIWRADPKFAGVSNCVGDIGSHVENMVHYLTGLKIKRLLATTNKFGYQLDLNANILVEYDNGANGAYWCSQVAAGRMNGLAVRVYGTLGSIEWEQHYPDYVRFTPKDGAPQLLSRGCGYLTESAASTSRLPFGHPEGLFVGFANIYKNVISAILKKKAGETPTPMELDFPDACDGLSGVKFVNAVVQSADNGSKWVELA